MMSGWQTCWRCDAEILHLKGHRRQEPRAHACHTRSLCYSFTDSGHCLMRSMPQPQRPSDDLMSQPYRRPASSHQARLLVGACNGQRRCWGDETTVSQRATAFHQRDHLWLIKKLSMNHKKKRLTNNARLNNFHDKYRSLKRSMMSY